jgi:hypothetical protein
MRGHPASWSRRWRGAEPAVIPDARPFDAAGEAPHGWGMRRSTRNPFNAFFVFFAVEESHRVNVGSPMTTQEEYVENAVESLELAERLASSSDMRRMLKLAEGWVELAKSNSPFEVIAA